MRGRTSKTDSTQGPFTAEWPFENVTIGTGASVDPTIRRNHWNNQSQFIWDAGNASNYKLCKSLHKMHNIQFNIMCDISTKSLSRRATVDFSRVNWEWILDFLWKNAIFGEQVHFFLSKKPFLWKTAIFGEKTSIFPLLRIVRISKTNQIQSVLSYKLIDTVSQT